MRRIITIEAQKREEMIEKKSKFIANIYPIQNAEDAEKKIREIRKQYHDARHHCLAYRVIEEDRILEKSSDDGEPSGTAGAPMLNLLQRNELCNVLVIVTRYFGGILLGTGGLVRAYSEVTAKVIENSEKKELVEGYEMKIELEYKDLELFKYYCRNERIRIIAVEYLENILLIIELSKKQKEDFLRNINDFKFRVINCKLLSERYILKKC